MQHEVLEDFVAYCKAHPELRFWQALRSWSGQDRIMAVIRNGSDVYWDRDTFYWTTRDGR